MNQPIPGPNGHVYHRQRGAHADRQVRWRAGRRPGHGARWRRDPGGRRAGRTRPGHGADRRGPDGPGPAGRRRSGTRPARRCSRPASRTTTSATTINRVCGSGLKAIMLAAAEIRAGDAEVVVAGGMEIDERRPYLVPGARFGYRLGNGELIDATVHDGLWCAIEDCHMGTHAERVAIKDARQPRGPGRVRAGQPPEGDRRHRRRPFRRRDGAGDRPRRQGPRDGRLGRRGPAARLDASRRWRGSSPSSTCPRARTAATRRSARSPRATRPGSPTARPRRSSPANGPSSGSA